MFPASAEGSMSNDSAPWQDFRCLVSPRTPVTHEMSLRTERKETVAVGGSRIPSRGERGFQWIPPGPAVARKG